MSHRRRSRRCHRAPIGLLCVLVLLLAAGCGDDGSDGEGAATTTATEGDGGSPGGAESPGGADADEGDEAEDDGGTGGSSDPAAAGGSCEVPPLDAPSGAGEDEAAPLALVGVDLSVDEEQLGVTYTFDRALDDEAAQSLLLDLAFLPGTDRESGMGQLRAFTVDRRWTGGYAEPTAPDGPDGMVLVPFEPDDAPAVAVDGEAVTATFDRALLPELEPPFEWAAAAAVTSTGDEGAVSQRPAGTCPGVPLGAGVPVEDLGELPVYGER